MTDSNGTQFNIEETTAKLQQYFSEVDEIKRIFLNELAKKVKCHFEDIDCNITVRNHYSNPEVTQVTVFTDENMVQSYLRPLYNDWVESGFKLGQPLGHSNLLVLLTKEKNSFIAEIQIDSNVQTGGLITPNLT